MLSQNNRMLYTDRVRRIFKNNFPIKKICNKNILKTITIKNV